MEFLKVTDLKVETLDGLTELSAHISVSDNHFESFRLWYRLPLEYAAFVKPTGDPFLVLLLPLAMQKKYNLRIDATVSERLLANIRQAQTILSGWFADMRPVEIQAAEKQLSHSRPKAVGSFFTGGVDSFYTVIKNLDRNHNEARISHLIYVHGFDIDLTNTGLFDTVNTHIKNIAEALDLQLINVSTNLRKFTDLHISWGKHESGPALASVGLALSPFFKTILIPSGHPYSKVYPTGTHPLLDPLWSNEITQFRQDGNEADRNQKVLWQISKHPVALKHLRVCWRNPGNSYNCGECAKCIRTKINLQLAGVLDQCETFDNEIDFERYEQLASDNAKEKPMLMETIDYLELNGGDTEVKAILQTIAENINSPLSLKERMAGFDKTYLNGLLKKCYSLAKKGVAPN